MATANNGIPLDAILSNETRYAKVTWHNATNTATVAGLADAKVRRLRRKPQDQLKPDYDQLRLADTLAGCAAGRRCNDGACVMCSRIDQLWLTQQIVRLASNEEERAVGFITLIPNVPLADDITGAALATVMADIRTKLEGTGVVLWAVLGLDVSYNDFTQVAEQWPVGERTSGWQPHVHGFVRVSSIRTFRKALPDLLPESTGVPTPHKTQAFDGSYYGASYALKYQFQRRVSFRDDTTGNLNAEDYSLTAEQDVKLMRAFSELGLSNRVALIGISIIIKSNGKVRLAVTK